jgi:hypothetical protein
MKMFIQYEYFNQFLSLQKRRKHITESLDPTMFIVFYVKQCSDMLAHEGRFVYSNSLGVSSMAAIYKNFTFYILYRICFSIITKPMQATE